jgi:hypothetical protein
MVPAISNKGEAQPSSLLRLFSSTIHFATRLSVDTVTVTMDDMHQRLLHNIKPFQGAMPAEIRRKPLRSSQPSEELLLLSGYAAGDNLYESPGVNSYTSIPLRQFAPSSSNDIKHPESYISQRGFLKSSAWRPGFWIRFPVLGIAALVMVILCRCSFCSVEGSSLIFLLRYLGSNHYWD